MKKLLAISVLAGVAFAGASAANAAEGCGKGFYRGPHGGCRPAGAVVAPGIAVAPGVAVAAPGIVIGNYYPGRGYWDGHRYYEHRERWHGGWRYR